MVGARWIALVVVALLAVGAAGCGSEERGTDVEKIALVVPGRDNEVEWSLQARAVVEAFPEQLGVRVDIADASQADDVAAVLEQVSQEGSQLVIADDSRYAEAAARVAAKTGVPELVWGAHEGSADGLVGGMTVQDKEGGYLAGIVAAKAAVTRRLGIVVAADGSDWDLATWSRTAGGFVAGARSADPHVRIVYRQVGSDGDATAAQMHDAAKRMRVRDHAQMLFALGGRSTSGAMRAIVEHRGAGETLYIGVVSDKSLSREEPGGVPYVLGSVMWEAKPVFRQALRDLRAGTFGEHPYALTLRDRGIWLFQTGRMPSDAYAAAMDAQAKIERGAIDIPVTPTAAAVERLIAAGRAAG